MDFAAFHRVLAAVVSSDRSIAGAYAAIVDHCASAHPHEDWARMAAIDVDDVSALETWLSRVLAEERPDEAITGLWFGIFNPTEDGTVTSELYVAGNPYRQGQAWFVHPEWWPAGRYGGYPLCLAHAALAVKHLAQRISTSLLLGSCDERTLVVGFDDGDDFTVGALSDRGFTYPAS